MDKLLICSLLLHFGLAQGLPYSSTNSGIYKPLPCDDDSNIGGSIGGELKSICLRIRKLHREVLTQRKETLQELEAKTDAELESLDTGTNLEISRRYGGQQPLKRPPGKRTNENEPPHEDTQAAQLPDPRELATEISSGNEKRQNGGDDAQQQAFENKEPNPDGPGDLSPQQQSAPRERSMGREGEDGPTSSAHPEEAEELQRLLNLSRKHTRNPPAEGPPEGRELSLDQPSIGKDISQQVKENNNIRDMQKLIDDLRQSVDSLEDQVHTAL